MDDDELEERDSRSRRQQQRFTFVLQAARVAMQDGGVAERRIRGIEGYVLNVVPRYTDTQFTEHYRITRSTFERVKLQKIKPNANSFRATTTILYGRKRDGSLMLFGKKNERENDISNTKTE
ncbi:hypothetical protein V5799_006706 [Amblyomma americanum]|uniref:Uncharacterized protein n=1 Tax=Amblyomma americanum TaxID=6943 RepID=A0AAQ4DVM4_AMBAM